MKTHLAQSATYLARLFRIEERPRELVIHWSGASAANVAFRGGHLKKNGGTDSTEDAAAASISSFDGDLYARMTTRLDGTIYFGLSADASGVAGNTIDFAIRVTSAGEVKVYESGSLKATHGTAARKGDHLRVQRVGTTVTYWLNRALIYTSAASSSGALFADAAIAHTDATVNEAVWGFVPTVIRVTEHTRRLTYGGELYTPLPLLPTRFNRSDGFRPGNTELTHILSSGGVSEADIIGGRWDFARYELIVLNYTDLTMGPAQRMVGRLGEFKVNTAGYFTAELRSLSQPLSQPIGDVVSGLCQAHQLGDFRCGQPMDNYTHDCEIDSVTNSLTLVLDLSPAKASGYFNQGLIWFRSGNNKFYEREIKSNTDNTIILQRPFPFAPLPGDEVTVFAGCIRTPEACKRFVNPNNPSGTNLENIQAYPHVPGLQKVLRYPE